jgi:transcriptional regulator with XRE-family HTH domain
MFADYLGVSNRMVSKWESAHATICPRPFNQRLLDVALEHANPIERKRFLQLLAQGSTPPVDDVRRLPPRPRIQKEPIAVVVQRLLPHEDTRAAMAERDIAALFRLLQSRGISQRQIAAATEQSQSEVSEILKGRRVTSYDVLVRIAAGLGVPRGCMGLAHDTPSFRPMTPSHNGMIGPVIEGGVGIGASDW